MSRQQATSTDTSSAAVLALPWSARIRAAVSVLLLLHLMAVIVAPLANPPPSSQLSQMLVGWFSPYLAAADLNHGYRFFAPHPGASSVVRYVLVMPDGTREEHQFPSVEEHWPRLIYHRHFMLSETTNGVYREMLSLSEPLDPPLPPEFEAQRQAERRVTQSQLAELLEGIGGEMLEKSGAERVEMSLVTHNIADPLLVAYEGVTINDPRWYEETPLGSLTVGESWTWPEELREQP